MRQTWDFSEHLKSERLPSRRAARMKPSSAHPGETVAFPNQISQQLLDLNISWVLKLLLALSGTFLTTVMFYALHGYDQTSQVFLEFFLLAKIRFTAVQEMFAC